MEFWTLIPVGIVIATFASLVGIGGGLIWAPYLILVEKMQPADAVMVSLIIQIFGMGSANYSYIKRKMIYWKLTFGLLPFIAGGMILGSFLAQSIAKGNTILLGLGIISMGTAILFAFRADGYNEILNDDKNMKAPLGITLASALFGTFSGMFSTGIGDFIIPLFRSKLKIPMQNAIGNSLFLNFSAALIGSAMHIFLKGHLNPILLWSILFGGIGVLIGGQLGPIISQKISEERLKEVFIFILMLIGLHMIYASL